MNILTLLLIGSIYIAVLVGIFAAGFTYNAIKGVYERSFDRKIDIAVSVLFLIATLMAFAQVRYFIFTLGTA